MEFTTSNSLDSSIGSGMPNQVAGDLLHTMDESKLSRVRTELQSLLIIAFLTPHPIEADGQPAGHRHLGDAPIATHGQMHEATALTGRKKQREESIHLEPSGARPPAGTM